MCNGSHPLHFKIPAFAGMTIDNFYVIIKQMKDKYWFHKCKKPIIGLAPMHGYTDSNFRLKCRKAGADVVYSEMVAAEAIIRRIPQAFEMLKFSEAERPVVLQMFGNNINSLKKAATILETEFHPDGIDLNFGCPVQKAAKQGFGATQLFDAKRAAQIVRALKKVLKKTPLSIKMRLVSSDIADTIAFVKEIKDAGIDLIAIHGRTATQKYKGVADWQKIQEVKKHFPDLPILGNGDIKTHEDLEKNLGNLDGALVGRAAKINPEVFRDLKN